MEVTKNVRGGLIFEKNDGRDLASKISELLSDEELCEEKRKECIELTKNMIGRK